MTQDKKKNTLDEIKGNEGFLTPPGYFDQFPSRLQDKISNKAEVQKPGLFALFKPQLALAASFIILAFLIYSGYKIILSKTNISENQPVSERILYEYLEENIQILDESLIIDNLTADNEGTTEDLYLSDDVIEYLIDNNIDYQDIINEF